MLEVLPEKYFQFIQNGKCCDVACRVTLLQNTARPGEPGNPPCGSRFSVCKDIGIPWQPFLNLAPTRARILVKFGIKVTKVDYF